AAVRQFEREGRGGALLGDLLLRRRGGVDDDDGAERGHPVITPAARLPQRAGAKTAALDQRRQSRGFAWVAALPARQGAVAERDAMKRRERRLRRRFDRVGDGLLGRLVAGAQ